MRHLQQIVVQEYLKAVVVLLIEQILKQYKIICKYKQIKTKLCRDFSLHNFFCFVTALLYFVVFYARLFPMIRLAKSLPCNQEARRWKI